MKTHKVNGFTVFELVIVLAILGLIIIVIGGSLLGCNPSHGTGEKIGTIVKLSKQGFISDTWEGQLIRGGMNGGSGSFGTTPFDFTVQDDETAKVVQKYMRDQTEVILHYRIDGIYSRFSSESDGQFLVSIEPAHEGSQNNGVKQ